MKKYYVFLFLFAFYGNSLNGQIYQDPALRGYWEFSGSFVDETGNFSGIPLGPLQFTTGKNGQANTALQFNGENTWINLGDGPLARFDNTQSFTLAALVFPQLPSPINTGQGDILRYDDFDNTDGDSPDIRGIMVYRLRYFANDYQVEFSYGIGPSNFTTVLSTPLPYNQWCHITAIRDMSTDSAYIYINGCLNAKAKDNSPVNWATTGQYLMCGKYLSDFNHSFFRGKIDELLIFGRTLASSEVKSLVDSVSIRYSEEFVSICPDTTYQGYNQAGSYATTFSLPDGCDSTHVIHLTIKEAPETVIERTICAGENWEGYTQEGVYTDRFERDSLCDSTRILHLEVIYNGIETVNVVIQEGESYEQYTETGVYMDSFLTSTGCTYIRILNLLVIPQVTEVCDSTFIKTFGISGKNLRGFSLAVGPDSTLFAVGSHGAVVVLMRLNLKGEILWKKEFELEYGMPVWPSQILVDSEGKISGSGFMGDAILGGSGFAFRFDPQTQELLWTRVYPVSNPTFIRGMIEVAPSGHLLLFSDSQSPNQVEFYLIDKTNGALILTQVPTFDLGGGETVSNGAVIGDALYTIGRYSFDGDFSSMRSAVSRFTISQNFAEDWTYLSHIPAANTARLYGQDMVMDNNTIISVHSGDEMGVSISNTQFFLQKTNLDGTAAWIKKYDVAGMNNEFIEEIVNVPDGYVLYGRTSFLGPADLIAVKTDKQGNVLWGRRIDAGYSDNFNQIASCQSKAVFIAGHYYFIASAQENINALHHLLLFNIKADGTVTDTCQNNIFPLQITTSDIGVTGIFPVNLIENTQNQGSDPGLSVDSEAVIRSRETCPCEECLRLTSVIDTAICLGDTLNGLYTSGLYVDTLTTINGCDSFRILNLMVLPVIDIHLYEKTICSGQSVYGYSESGIYSDTLLTAGGCIAQIFNLTVVPAPVTILDSTICSGELVFGYSETGAYTDTLITLKGCDSIRVLNLTVLPTPAPLEIDTTVCEGVFVFGYGQSGTYRDTFVAANGCDSVRTLILKVIPGIQSFVIDTILCKGASIFGYQNSGIYTDTITEAGCQQLRILDLHVRDNFYRDTVFIELCGDERFRGAEAPGIIMDTLSGEEMCNTIRVHILEDNNIYIPNAFRPGSTGGNEYFEIGINPGSTIEIVSFEVYDRWGGLVYQVKQSNTIQWDGKLGGKTHSPGVFVYHLSYYCDGVLIRRKGSITVL